MGMKLCAGALILLLVPGALAASVVAPTKSELEAMYGVAARELNAGHLREALQQLDAIDARQPDMAAAKNLRGVVLMRQSEYGLAERALQRAREIDPGLWEARFNLAEIPFLRGSWAEARRRFEALAEEKSEEVEGATGDLVQFKILLTYLLEDKEKKATEILERLKSSTLSPAYYCGKAALAFRHRDGTEARVALKAAEKSFSPRLYKLFVESFYEIGWMKKPEGSEPVALEVASRADMVARAQEAFAKAEQAFKQQDYEETLRLLGQVDAAAPNQAVAHNLRGKVLLAQGKDEAAETALQEAVAVDPQFLEARYNLTRIPFKKRDYDGARKQLEALLGATSGGRQQRQAEQLIRYQIFLTLLLEGRDAPAQKAMDEFKMMDDSPALYYAQAAWAFQHGNSALGNTWVANARNLYPEDQGRAFAEPFADLGWSSPAGAPPIAREAPPSVEPSPGPKVVAAPNEETPDAHPLGANATGRPFPPPKPAATPAVPARETEATESKQAEAGPTPEVSVKPEKLADASKSARSDDSSERVKKKRRSAASEARSRPKSSRGGAVAPEAPRPTNSPTPAATASSERPTRTFGDKVARFFLYPFQHPIEQPTPNPVIVPGKSPSPTPRRRKN